MLCYHNRLSTSDHGVLFAAAAVAMAAAIRHRFLNFERVRSNAIARITLRIRRNGFIFDSV